MDCTRYAELLHELCIIFDHFDILQNNNRSNYRLNVSVKHLYGYIFYKLIY